MSTKELADRLENLEQLGTRLETAVKALNEPVYPSRLEGPSRQEGGPPQAFGPTRVGNRFVPPQGYRTGAVWKSLGDFTRQLISGQNTSEFTRKVVSGFSALHGAEFMKTVQGMSEAIGSDGGFGVLPEYSSQILERIYQNDLLSRTDSYTVAGNTMTFPRNAETSRANGSRRGGIRGYWVAEGGTITASKPTFGLLNLRLKKMAVLVYLTQELIEDTGAALEAYITRAASDEFAFLIGDALINGTGAGQPLGILNSGAKVAVDKESGQAANTIVFQNVQKMWSRMIAPSRSSAVWLINQDAEPQLNAMSVSVGSGGQMVYLPSGGLSQTPYATLMGRPVLPTEFNATLGTEGDLILADLSQYLTIAKGGIAQAASMHIEFLSDQLALRFTLRLDGEPWENSPITPYKGTNTQSAFVTLATRA